jgi:uncharacterized Tic20 family protein
MPENNAAENLMSQGETTPIESPAVEVSPEVSDVEVVPDFLSLDDTADAETVAPDLDAVAAPVISTPIAAPDNLDLGDPQQVAQVTYGQTQQAYTQPTFSEPAPTAPGYAEPQQPSEPFAPYGSNPYAPPPPPAGPYYATPGQGMAPVYGRPGDTSMASMAHWLPILVGLWAPLIIMLTTGERDRFVRENAVEALNFNLTLLIVYCGAFFLGLFTAGLGFLVFMVLPVVALVFQIQGAMAANRGELYRYPLNIRMVK